MIRETFVCDAANDKAVRKMWYGSDFNGAAEADHK